ncbi:double-strand break repair protein AddB [Thalassospira sp. A40-3]|uniref:double-strand break repair protein AddB n=1 Tax=unclassified Thalassospira TaxID=2648997 RepID=UPI0018CDF164|nr:double-strand break repair protein AddB [Thalassospira sp. A40-3]QPO11601.1 double-strand break repair protein AddB [Thalassospira sp. A40-3]
MADLFDYMDAPEYDEASFAGEATPPSNLFFIPPGVAFADLIAKQLMAETADQPDTLPDYVLMVPNRRSAKVMRDAFLRQSQGAVTLLPTIRPLGEADEDELAIYGAGGEQAALDLPPAIPDLQRKLLLTQLIMGRPDHRGEKPTADQAARLAGELARFLDQVQTENCAFDDLKGLVPEEFAEHWQLTLEFLQILTIHWPGILASQDVSDRAMRRNALIAAQIDLWEENPPETPVLIVGSTGPFPALRDLMAAVLRMPQGRVVLPGLMTGLSHEDWAAIADDAAHPQHLLGKTLGHIGRHADSVLPWPALDPENDATIERRRLAREALRPAKTTHHWRHITGFIPDVMDGVLRVDCSGAREEATTIALMMREALEHPEKTCALVTPDRGLARRVATELRRWEVEIDDSAGIPLHDTAPAIYLRLVVRAVQEEFAPVPLLELLKHPLSAAGLSPEKFRVLTRLLEKEVLRGARPGPGLDGLQTALDGWCEDTVARLSTSGANSAIGRIERIRDDHARLSDLVARIKTCLDPIDDLTSDKTHAPVHLLRSHVTAAEALAASDTQTGADRLWRGEAGEALADFVHELLNALTDFAPMPGNRYSAFLDALMADRAVRPRYGKHPRLFIWGTVEAQMQQADLTILGGLNEGVWPPEAGADPWMSRPMRRNFGLPAPEHRVGQSAHDFQQLFCSPDVVMTRALRIEGTPTVPSRWLLRIENILRKSGVSMEKPDAAEWRALADLIDEPASSMRIKIGRPAPKPPASARPDRLSVTQIETWMRDPYAIYARHILGLRKLDGIDEDPGAADYGNLIHDALDQFIARHPEHLPPDGEHELLIIGREVFEPLAARPGLWAFWWPRFERIAKWFIQTEAARRDAVRKSYTEQSGTLDTSSGFQVYARADRIDQLRDGGIAIIDYKTGAPPSQGDVANGFAPQLPLEAAIAEKGGFGDVPAGPPASMAFWKLSGGDPAGEIVEINTGRMKTTPAELAHAAVEGVNGLAAAFADPATPYLSVPHPDHAPKYSDYVHLARLREWMGSEDVDDSANIDEKQDVGEGDIS